MMIIFCCFSFVLNRRFKYVMVDVFVFEYNSLMFFRCLFVRSRVFFIVVSV